MKQESRRFQRWECQETYNAAFYDGDGRFSRNDLVIPQKLPHAGIDPQTMQFINVVRCEWTHRQPRRFYQRKAIRHKGAAKTDLALHHT
jgi:hypothetical protein